MRIHYSTISLIIIEHVIILIESAAMQQSSNKGFQSSLSRKSIYEGFWNSEVQSELLETNTEFTFYKPDDRETFMAYVESKQKESLYEHKCFDGCKERGIISTYS